MLSEGTDHVDCCIPDFSIGSDLAVDLTQRLTRERFLSIEFPLYMFISIWGAEQGNTTYKNKTLELKWEQLTMSTLKSASYTYHNEWL